MQRDLRRRSVAQSGSDRSFPFAIARVVAILIMVCGCGDDSVGPGGAGPRPLLIEGAYSDPVWIPGGETIMFNYRPLKRIYEYPPGSGRYFAEFNDSLSGFYTLTLGSATMRRIWVEGLAHPEATRDGSHIYYDSGRQIWRVSIAGDSIMPGSDEVLTGFQNGAFHPSVAGDGVRLLFSTSGTAPQPGIYLLRLGEGTVERVGQSTWFSPRWSADGDSLAFSDAAAIPYSLGFADSSGVSDGSRIPGAGEDRWSPDGQWIAYAARDPSGSQPRLWIMRPDGSAAHALTSETVSDAFSWSPDNKRIAYVRYNTIDYSYINGTIWIVDIESMATVQVTFNTPP